MSGFVSLTSVVRVGDASKVVKVAKKYGVKYATISLARGTAHSRFLDVLMLNEIRKEIITMLVETNLASDAMKGISKDMRFDKPHHGIVFSHSVSELNYNKESINDISEDCEVNNSMFKAIYIIVDKGKAEDVIEVANKAGARGATILNARASGIHEAEKFFSVEIEPEREKVFIIAQTEIKDAILTAVKNYLDAKESGNGLIYVMDVGEAYGLHVG